MAMESVVYHTPMATLVYTSSKFSPEIEPISKNNNIKESDLKLTFPKLNDLIIESDALVAFSGIGGSSGPHYFG